MQLRLLRKLIYKLMVDENVSICDTCEYNHGTGCKNYDKCKDNLEGYEPNEKVINEL